MNPIIIVSKFYQYSNILIQFAHLIYPQVQIEAVRESVEIDTEHPYRVVVVLEDDKNECEKLMKRYPGQLRFVSRNHLITDFDKLLRDEGYEQRDGR
jgi:hypothetical protein